MGESLRQRIGVDLGRRVAAEEGIAWAIENDVHYVDIQTDIAPNAFESFDDARCKGIQDACEQSGLHLGLHTLSGVNVAEISPFLRHAVDDYLKAYIDLSRRIGAEWIVVHGGYHFTSCRKIRMQASIERLQRVADYAEKQGSLLLLENLNGEPERAEVHYMPDTLEDTLYYFEQIQSPNLQWAFTINHAHYDPIGIAGFVDGMDMSRCAEVRVADNNGEYEIHMQPGTGTVDFADMFKRIEGTGFSGHYMNGFGTPQDMLDGRDYMLARAREAGVAGAWGKSVVCVDRGGVGVTNHPSEQFLFSSGLGGTGLSAAEIAKRLLAHGVRIGPESETSMRAVTHLDISRSDVEEIAGALAVLVSEK